MPSRSRLLRTIAALGVATALGPAGAQEPGHHAALPAAAGVLTLEAAVAAALERNPDLAAARERAGAAEARARAAGRFPAPSLEGQLWQQPLEDPFAFDQANMWMLGVRQMIPAPGSLSLRERAGRDDAAARDAEAESRRLEVVSQVRRAFAAYAHAAREQAIHRQHLVLNERLVELARLRFEAASLSKRDVLRTTFELSRLHADVSSVGQRMRASTALLARLMASDPALPLPPPEQRSPTPASPDLAALETSAEASPAVAVAAREVAAAEAALEAARREASWPELMVGADYGYMPMEERHTYTLMLGLPLPWLSGARRDAVAAADRSLAAARHALASARDEARYAVREAAARVDAAREALEILDRDLVPQAQRSAEQAENDLGTGRADAMSVLEAFHTLLTVRLERSRALLALEEASADVDRAAGVAWPAQAEGASR
jgi:cobalt-zinc-cadmium efflux system outer membrane protein